MSPTRTAHLSLPEPRVVRIPSKEAKSVEAALEDIVERTDHRFDVWVMSFHHTQDAIVVRQRLDEEPRGRAVALVALVEDFDPMHAAEAMAAGVKALFPSNIPAHNLERILQSIVDRQRELGAFAAVKRQRDALALQEAKIRATEQSLARRVYGALTPLTGEVAPVHPLREAVEQFERLYISRVLAEVQGDGVEAMRVLGVSRSSFYRFLAQHKLHHLVKHGADGEPHGSGGEEH